MTMPGLFLIFLNKTTLEFTRFNKSEIVLTFKHAYIKLFQKENSEILIFKCKTFEYSFSHFIHQNIVHFSEIKDSLLSNKYLLHFVEPKCLLFEEISTNLSHDEIELTQSYFSTCKFANTYSWEFIVPLEYLDKFYIDGRNIEDFKRIYC